MTVRNGLRTFLDSSVLVYSDDAAAPEKPKIALDLIENHQYRGSGVVSVQVLQEYFVSSTKKLRVDALVAREKVEIFSSFDVAIPTPSDIVSAIDLHRIHGV